MFGGVLEKFQPSLIDMYKNIFRLLGNPADIWVQVNPIGNFFETFVVSLAIIGITLQARHNVWGWIFMAIAAAFLPYFLYTYYGLVGDSLLWIIMFLWFTITGIWGWWHWIIERGKARAEDHGITYDFREMVRKSHMADLTFYPEFEEDYIKTKVNSLDWFQSILLIPAIFTLTIAFAWFTTVFLPDLASKEDLYFQPALPYWDALTTVLACFAQFLLIRKYWQAWVIWWVVGFVSVGVYAEKAAWTLVIMYAVILVIATISVVDWFKKYKAQQQQQA